MTTAERSKNWQNEFQKAKETIAQVKADLHRWELLGTQARGGPGERSTQGALLRGKVSQLKVTFEKLARELQMLQSNPSDQPEATRKQISVFRDELAQATSEIQEFNQRLKRGSFSSPPPLPKTGDDRPFVRLSGGDGAEMQQVATLSNRQLVERQKQMMRDLDEPLNELEGTMTNLQNVSSMIQSEIVSQNRMLDNTNEAAERVTLRMGRTRSLMRQVMEQDKSKYLLCIIVGLLAALIIIFIYVVAP
eukprot:TRINITY_DN22972_c0_g1_i1.p1 TRINITY_DN22972_c0_g1~~TRINITY_DN22972_c0_g1_i1.p1  ORF type:complete len:285 (+),score=52.48 TRINITY_DN22972_c0_g1_i1:109-855(+)